MRVESRELYCYTTGTEPFKSRYENLSTEMISLFIATRGLVKDAIGQYGKDYGNGNGFVRRTSRALRWRLRPDAGWF